MNIPFLNIAAMHAEIEQELDDVWQRITRSGTFIGGQVVHSFEDEWAEYCGTKYCVGLASGTSALQLALSALGIGPNEEVIVPAMTFFATIEAVLAVGAKPVFVDVDPATLLMTAANVENAVTSRTAAVIPVHLYGQVADMDGIRSVSQRAGLAIIEDASQAHGSAWHGRRAGTFSDVGCFSFYPGKNLGALGDAGAIVTNDQHLAERIRSMSNHGRSPHDHCRHDVVSGNHRLDALQAGILSVKLRRLDDWNERRRQVAAWYRELLIAVDVESIQTAPGALGNAHLQVIQIDNRERIRSWLETNGIATGVHYSIACHRQPALALTEVTVLPEAERAAGRVLSLPMGPHLTRADVSRVVDAIAGALKEVPRMNKESVAKEAAE